MLSHRVGVQNLEAVEDAVQSALIKALQSWSVNGEPENPSAWLFRVASNEIVGELRKRECQRRIVSENADELVPEFDIQPEGYLPGEISDDLLRMLFVCCDKGVPVESQLIFALKTLCGFSVQEIALRMFTTEANVYKRLARARGRLQENASDLGELSGVQHSIRLPAVQKTLYLMFTEGYLSSHTENSIRRELCDEAIRLAVVLAKHPVGQTPETFALVSLMYLHVARMPARQDASGGLLLLEEQDRTLWDRCRINEGLHWLSKSAAGENFSRYHAEAGIAAEHCLAPSFEEDRKSVV